MSRILYCFGESGNAYKAALTLELAGLEWTAEWVDFFHGATRSPEFQALNSMGEVPVFKDGDRVISQSALIQRHIADSTNKFGGTTDQEIAEIWRWTLFENQKISGHAGPLRFNMNFLPTDKRDPGLNSWLAMRLRAGLKVLNTHLTDREWIVGNAPTIADFANCGYLFYEEPFTFARTDYPAIDAWLSRISALPGWKHPYDLMPGSPVDRA